MQTLSRDIAKDLLDIKAVFLQPNDPFTWASGIQSPIYTDNRITISYPEVRRRIAKGFAERIRAEFPDVEVIAGAATGGAHRQAGDQGASPRVLIWRRGVRHHPATGEPLAGRGAGRAHPGKRQGKGTQEALHRRDSRVRHDFGGGCDLSSGRYGSFSDRPRRLPTSPADRR